jgi:hypothetical protein
VVGGLTPLANISANPGGCAFSSIVGAGSTWGFTIDSCTGALLLLRWPLHTF